VLESPAKSGCDASHEARRHLPRSVPTARTALNLSLGALALGPLALLPPGLVFVLVEGGQGLSHAAEPMNRTRGWAIRNDSYNAAGEFTSSETLDAQRNPIVRSEG
jgi:hypothetical protein